MNKKSQAGLRLVKCPKCGKILPEPEQVPVYACGGCNTILQAKYYKNNLNARGKSLHQAEAVQGNGVANAASGGESDGSSQRSSPGSRHSLDENEVRNQNLVVNCNDSAHHTSISDGSISAYDEENRKTDDDIAPLDQKDSVVDQNHEECAQEQVPDLDSAQETLVLEEGSVSNESEKEADGMAGQCLSEKLEGIKLDEGDSVSVCSSVKDIAIPGEESGAENQLHLRNSTRNHGFFPPSLPSHQSYEAPYETGSSSSYGKPETWLRKGHICTKSRPGNLGGRRRRFSEEAWRENDQFLAAMYSGYETTSGEIYPRASREIYPRTSRELYPRASEERVSGEIYPRASEEIHPGASGEIYRRASREIYPRALEEIYSRESREIYPRAGYQYHDDYHTYIHRRRRSESWSQNGSHPRMPYSGEVFNRGCQVLQNPYIYQHQYPGKLRRSAQFPSVPPAWEMRWDPYEPEPYQGSRHVVFSGGHRHRDQIMRRTYVREKRQAVKRHLEPIAGGAPFISCYFCSRVLRVPADFLRPRRGKRKTQMLKCGACSNILEFCLQKETDVTKAEEDQVQDEDGTGLVSVSDQSVGSCRKEDRKPRPRNEESIEGTEAENGERQSPVQGRPMKVTWKLPAQTKSPLHKLMGYSSPHDLLKEVI